MLCPFDCGACRDAECRGACRLTGEPMLEVCWLCGEIAMSLSRAVVCVRCADDAPPQERRQRESLVRRSGTSRVQGGGAAGR